MHDWHNPNTSTGWSLDHVSYFARAYADSTPKVANRNILWQRTVPGFKTTSSINYDRAKTAFAKDRAEGGAGGGGGFKAPPPHFFTKIKIN